MSLEASDLHHLSHLEVYLWMYFKDYLKTSASLLDIIGKSKEISQDLRKTIVDLHKSGSSLGAISKRLKVPHSSVQTIVWPRSRHTAQEGDAFCLLEMNVLWCEKCKSIPEQLQRTLWRCWRKHVQKYLYPQSNEFYIDITWQAAQQGRSHCSKIGIKKPDYGLHLHMVTKIVLSSGLMKQKYNFLAIMTIIMFGGKRGRLASRRTPWQPYIIFKTPHI